MRKLLKILAGVIVVLLLLVGGALAFAYFGSEWKLHRKVAIEVQPVAIATDEAGLDRGRYLFLSRGCAECHGTNGAGKTVIDSGGLLVKSPNITTGDGSVIAKYKDVDWVAAIRHGVKPNGEPLLIMPSEDYNRLTDRDFGALVGYIKTLPPASGGGAEFKLPLPVRFMYAAGFIRDAAQKINHRAPPQLPISPADLVASGRYVANSCIGCHNEALSGGKIPGAPPDWPPAANLTQGDGGTFGRYPTAQGLAAMFRTGKRPDGTKVNDVMPFDSLKEFSDEDIHALHAYLMTLPPQRTGEKD